MNLPNNYRELNETTAFMMLRTLVPRKVLEMHLGNRTDVLYYLSNMSMRAQARIIVHFKDYLSDKVIVVRRPHRYLFYSRESIFIHSVPIEYKLISDSLADKLRYNTHVPFADNIFGMLNSQFAFQNTHRHFHQRKNGDISFMPAHKPTVLADQYKWAQENRQTTKLGRAVRQMFKTAGILNPYYDEEIEKIHNQLMRDYIFDGTISIVDDDDILKYYHVSSYADDTGELHNSCMKYDESQKYISFYAQNPSTKMVIALNPQGKLIGRAILWKDVDFETDYGSETYNFCDRIYGKPIVQTKIKEYVQNLGYVTKQYQNYDSPDAFVMPNGAKFVATARTEVIEHKAGYPYFDTFKYATHIGDVELNNSHGDYGMTSMHGNHLAERVYCEYNDEYYSEDECHYSNYHECYIHADDAVWSEYLDDYLHPSRTVWCDIDATEMPNDYDDLIEYRSPNGWTQYTIESDNVVWGSYDGYGQYILADQAVHAIDIDQYIYQSDATAHTLVIDDKSITYYTQDADYEYDHTNTEHLERILDGQ